MLKQFIAGMTNKFLGYRFRIVERELNHKVLKVYDGSVRRNTDKDDAWFVLLAQHASVLFDIGANIGYTGLLTNTFSKPSHLVLVDPNPLALSTAATNLIMNGLSENCHFMSAFVSDTIKEKVKFYTIGRGAAGSIYSDHAKSAAKLNSWYWVSTTTLDEIADIMHLQPDLVKIDVEGAEEKVLAGAENICRSREVIFMVEVHSNRFLPMATNAEKILNWCLRNNYKAWYMKDAVELSGPKQISHRGRCHLLLLPDDKPYPEYLMKVKEYSPLPEM